MRVCVIADLDENSNIKSKIYEKYFCYFNYFSQSKIHSINKNYCEVILVKSRFSSLKLKKLLKEILFKFNSIPILLCLSKSNSKERAEYLNLGIQECVSGKICHEEILVRLALLSENKTNKDILKSVFSYNNFSFCLVTKRALYKQKEIILNKKETLLLEALIKRKNTTVPRSLLYNLSWEKYESPNPNSLETHICSLRRKINKKCGFKLIKTIWGVGYTITA